MQPDTQAKLDTYHQLLLLWQKTINLVSPNTIDDAWNRHFEDALQLLPFIPQHIETLWDLGSGAGFPGLVIAIARPDVSVNLVKSDTRKSAFLQTVSRETHCGNVFVRNDRLEDILDILPPPQMMTARAFAPLEKILRMTQPVWEANPDLFFVLPKGRKVNDEIEQAQKCFTCNIEHHRSTIDPHSCVLIVSNVKAVEE